LFFMASPVVSLTCTFRRSGNKATGNRTNITTETSKPYVAGRTVRLN